MILADIVSLLGVLVGLPALVAGLAALTRTARLRSQVRSELDICERLPAGDAQRWLWWIASQRAGMLATRLDRENRPYFLRFHPWWLVLAATSFIAAMTLGTVKDLIDWSDHAEVFIDWGQVWRERDEFTAAGIVWDLLFYAAIFYVIFLVLICLNGRAKKLDRSVLAARWVTWWDAKWVLRYVAANERAAMLKTQLLVAELRGPPLTAPQAATDDEGPGSAN